MTPEMPLESVHISRLVYDFLFSNGYPFTADAFAKECPELMALKYQPDQFSSQSIPPLAGPTLVDMLENYSNTQKQQRTRFPVTTFLTSSDSECDQSSKDSAIALTGQAECSSHPSVIECSDTTVVIEKGSAFTFNWEPKKEDESKSSSTSVKTARPRNSSMNRMTFHGFSSSSSEFSFHQKNEKRPPENQRSFPPPACTAVPVVDESRNPKTGTRLKVKPKRPVGRPRKHQPMTLPHDIRPCSVVLRRVIQLYVPKGEFQLSA